MDPELAMINRNGTLGKAAVMKKLSKLWEREYQAIMIAPKRYGSTEMREPSPEREEKESLSPILKSPERKIDKIVEGTQDLTRHRSSMGNIQMTTYSPKHDQMKVKLYKSLKIDKLFTQPRGLSLSDKKPLQTQASMRKTNKSISFKLVSPRSSVVSIPSWEHVYFDKRQSNGFATRKTDSVGSMGMKSPSSVAAFYQTHSSSDTMYNFFSPKMGMKK
jgi:hypothetical protein